LEDDFEEAFAVVGEAGEPGSAIGEGDAGAGERVNADGAVADALDGFRVFTRAGAGAVDGDLAGDDFLEREGDGGLEVSDEDYGAAFADAADGEVDGSGCADDFEGNGEAIGVELAGVGGEIFLAGVVGLVGAELAGEFEAFRVEIDGGDVFPAAGFEGLDDEEADEACTDDEGGFVCGGWGEVDGVEGDGDGFGEGGVLEGEVVRDAVEDACGEGDFLGEAAVAAVVGAGYAEDFSIRAEVDVSCQAGGAFAAEFGGVEGDAIADVPAGDVVADGGDGSGGFVAHDDGGDAAAGEAVHAVDVAAADAAGAEVDEDLVGSGSGVWEVCPIEG